MLLIATPLVLALGGCRPPAIPPQPSRAEYAVYNAWLDHFSSTQPAQLPFFVDAHTHMLRQQDLQFQECLPSRMRGLLDGFPTASLTASSGNDWLRLSDGRPASLRDTALASPTQEPAEWIRLSRVAFTLSGYDAYLWEEHQVCGVGSTACREGYGALLHGRKSDGVWSFEETSCQAMIPPDTTIP